MLIESYDLYRYAKSQGSEENHLICLSLSTNQIRKKKAAVIKKNADTIERSLTGHIQQVFQGFDCPILPESASCSHQDTASCIITGHSN